MKLAIELAVETDAPALHALRCAVALHLTAAHGRGHWSSCGTGNGAIRDIRTSRVLLARRGADLVGTLRLATKKPWAIKPELFTPAKRPIYLLGMAVAPGAQRQGIGRALLKEAVAQARAWPGDALWLDAYDAPAGAGGFYAACGFREVGRASYRGVPLIYFEQML